MLSNNIIFVSLFEAICNERRGADAGTCENEGKCLRPGICQCPSSQGFSPYDCSGKILCHVQYNNALHLVKYVTPYV